MAVCSSVTLCTTRSNAPVAEHHAINLTVAEHYAISILYIWYKVKVQFVGQYADQPTQVLEGLTIRGGFAG
jgi:hypothetical protein